MHMLLSLGSSVLLVMRWQPSKHQKQTRLLGNEDGIGGSRNSVELARYNHESMDISRIN
jgi:hypothetical protein